MSVRKITDKSDRIRVVTWIRSGAPLMDGVSLYTSLPYDANLLARLRKNPSPHAEQLYNDICELMGISRLKFQSIINQYHGQKHQQITKPDDSGSQDKIKRRDPDEKRHQDKNPSGRSFRNEWPFLSEPGCPAQLKALAADKISCWERYTDAHDKLFDCSSLDECYQVAHSLIENFKENRLIYEELDFYKSHGSVLGKHPIWNQYKRFEDLRGKNVIELVRLAEKTLPHRIWRIESEIKKGDKPHLLGERERRLKEVKAELAEVRRLLGMDAG